MTSLIVSYVFDYGYRCLLVAEDSPFLKNHTVSYFKDITMIKKRLVIFVLIYLYSVFEKQWLLTAPDIGGAKWAGI